MEFLLKPSSDFAAVRDGRTSMPLWMDIDLTTARSIAAGTAQVLNIAGNSFYVDADTTNVGTATLHFQDTNLGQSSAPFLAAPGFVANVAFTQILIENTAQAGKRLRIFYGVDIDFRAGVNASVISGSVTIANKDDLNASDYNGSYANNGVFAANTAIQVVAPATNTNGLIVLTADLVAIGGAASLSSLIAKAGAPANVADGDVLVIAHNLATNPQAGKLNRAVKVAAGKGLYFIANGASTNSLMSALYKLL
jgi:hypothetical protein